MRIPTYHIYSNTRFIFCCAVNVDRQFHFSMQSSTLYIALIINDIYIILLYFVFLIRPDLWHYNILRARFQFHLTSKCSPKTVSFTLIFLSNISFALVASKSKAVSCFVLCRTPTQDLFPKSMITFHLKFRKRSIKTM